MKNAYFYVQPNIFFTEYISGVHALIHLFVFVFNVSLLVQYSYDFFRYLRSNGNIWGKKT